MNQFCECAYDGWCPRFQRTMMGRFHEICAGVNCDLGTAAAFRDQWARESGVSHHLNPSPNPTKLLLKINQAPGDAVVMTAAIHSLHQAYPGMYITAVESAYPEVFAHNPNVAVCPPPDSEECSFRHNWLQLQMHYPAIHDSNKRGIHFMQAWCEFLGYAIGKPVPLLTNRPHLYFQDPEPEPNHMNDKWLVCSGGKKDFTNKLWGHSQYEEVVRILGDKVKFIQVGKSRDDHPPLEYVWQDMVNMTTMRGLFELVRRSRGVLCGVSLLMHVAAALEKPAVIIAGGREPVQWNAYPKQHYLHTVGMLPCYPPLPQGREGDACWRSRLYPLGDNQVLDQNICLLPDTAGMERRPTCMSMIRPERVAELILAYENGNG